MYPDIDCRWIRKDLIQHDPVIDQIMIRLVWILCNLRCYAYVCIYFYLLQISVSIGIKVDRLDVAVGKLSVWMHVNSR